MSTYNTNLVGSGPIPSFTKKGKVQVDKFYWGTNELFNGLFKCQVLTINNNSAVVKIYYCQNAEDDQTQYDLEDKTVVSLKSLIRFRETA